jgi:hypothetical protein
VAIRPQLTALVLVSSAEFVSLLRAASEAPLAHFALLALNLRGVLPRLEAERRWIGSRSIAPGSRPGHKKARSPGSPNESLAR